MSSETKDTTGMHSAVLVVLYTDTHIRTHIRTCDKIRTLHARTYVAVVLVVKATERCASC